MIPLAETLRDLGSESIWVVHGNGLDEITTTGTTQVAALEQGKIRSFELTPGDFGVAQVELAALKGGDGEYNAKALRAVLEGEKMPIATWRSAMPPRPWSLPEKPTHWQTAWRSARNRWTAALP